jgi:hypothetical protein
MEQSKVLYEIAYDKTRQTVIVYPKWRGPRPNHQVIGEFTPENPRANLEDYYQDLGKEIELSLARVGEPSYEPFRITITPLDGTKEVMLKDIRAPLERVPVEDQVPVGLNRTVAEATAAEQEQGTPEPVATQATRELARKEFRDDARLDQESEPSKRPAKKAATKNLAKAKATKVTTKTPYSADAATKTATTKVAAKKSTPK